MVGGITGKVDADDFKRLATATKDADKDVQKAVRKALRDVAKPLGMAAIKEGSAQMPARGGLRARLSAGRPGVRASFNGNPKVTIVLSNRSKDGFASLNSGTLRHPVFARNRGRKKGGFAHAGERKGWAWVSQKVPAGTYDRAFEAGAPVVRRKVLDATNDVLNDIARKVN